ncbi:DUF4166 domain-containing protein [Chitinimonas arctica]|uniref:DUF4166 domain-containing protein n=1 Tax=Chitinimonas arctica TaxID=2594795 RepID=A0A516SED8_9NEIS|nr:DUF4166 domain-containing protein [Chitinimonas arctica]QDQ26522.1 DUF4166 domain-containing protein [Chitinimonas arctica]
MTSLYQTALGDDFERLSPLLRQFHREPCVPWQGCVDVSWPRQAMLRILLGLGRLPHEGQDRSLRVEVRENGAVEHWQRNFAGRLMASRQYLTRDGLCERFGPFTLLLESRVDNGELRQRSVRTRFCGIPLPAVLALQVGAREWQENGRFHFDVAIGVGNSPLLRYFGSLLPG